ncbi:hypothetical protein M0D21_13515 [Aquimarina sp. D1M17]|uniref:hypothetical protein n=1 Tax=Aquimarina acroporae TaxID=2937283 RepID=UPI0020C0E643|nr:hypothetical protein [Aquimarina acroporae]MCK8522597.1 hypothetical protein [Aquimarina acroporae]
MKVFKITLLILAGIVAVIALFFGYIYYKHIGKYTTDTEKYPHYIGHLDPNTTLSNESFEVCDDPNIFKTHHGAAPEAFKFNKGIFRKKILENYENSSNKDAGYIFFRFIVNCKGETGRFEITTTDLELNQGSMSHDIIDQLYQLTSNTKHWNILETNNKPIDYYVYIAYKIQNGEITEILP